LEALKSLEGEAKKDETSTTNTALSPVDEISESLVQRGAKSDRSPQSTLLALLAPRRLAYLKRPRTLLSSALEELTDCLNAPVQGTGADGLKLALALLWERRDECPGAVPVLVCHDEVVVECNAEHAADAKAWLKEASVEGMEEVLNGPGVEGPCVPVEVEVQIAETWAG
jgi:DNA polymerase I-like protein with 3'-5' exonuclease and polymerase domains